MKKRNLLTKLLTMSMAAALIFGDSTYTMTVHAGLMEDGNYDDGCYHGNGREPGGDGGECIPIDLSNPENLTPGSLYESGSDSGNSGSGDGGSSCAASLGDSGNSGTATAPSGSAAKGNTATIPGCETFRHIWYPREGRASVYHCGIEQYTAQLMGADGNAVAYRYASPYKDATTDKWYLNIVTEDGVDTTGYTIGTWKGSVAYLPRLGMSGVMLNQTLMVDAEAAAAAK